MKVLSDFSPCLGGTDRQADSKSVSQADIFSGCQGCGEGEVGVASPVDSSTSFQCHPVKGEVDLADKGRHPPHHSVGHVQDHLGLQTHYPGGGRHSQSTSCSVDNLKSEAPDP